MIKLKNLTVKNFMSVGNATQAVNFDRQDLTLVLGENVDLGGDGSRNGTGKTSIINAVSYALFGNALTNIKKDNLINKTNSKNMLVSLDFEIRDTRYRIERGRKPNVLKFFVNDEERQSQDDNSQGDSRETQQEIERILGMSHDMFKHVVALNTYTEPFLSLRANDQRSIIEQLLGITLLSEKADKVKEHIRSTKDLIQQEEYKIKATRDANQKIQDQIDNLKRRQLVWKRTNLEEIQKLESAIVSLNHVDIDREMFAHVENAKTQQNSSELKELKKWLSNIKSQVSSLTLQKETIQSDINSIQDHKCHACGQILHDQNQDQLLKKKQDQKLDVEEKMTALLGQQTDFEARINDLASKNLSVIETFYPSIQEAQNHKNSLDILSRDLERAISQTDPYEDQIQEMNTNAIQEISYDTLNDLTRLLEHQEFLLKLLTNKDSFIRKKIIDQNLSFLNNRLTHYLDTIGLPHSVVFQNDLNVEITELGRDLDFDNLSRGERNRLILSLSWAFRDVWENLYHPINLLFIDELIDSGMDSQGVESSLGILKKMARERNKSIWLVSHKDDLSSRVNNIFKVIKENGFTNFLYE